MPSFVTVTSGATAQAQDVNQVIAALNGTAGSGIPISLTAVNDSVNFALAVKNADPTNSRSLQVLRANNNVLIQADVNGVIVSPDGGATTAQVVNTTLAQTLTNKTLTSPTINTPVFANGALAPPAVALQTVSAQLGVDTALAANTNTQLLTIALSVGTWLIFGGLTVNSPTAGTNIDCTIRDETTGGGAYLTNGRVTAAAANAYATALMSSIPYVVATGTPTISLRADSITNASTAWHWDGTYQGAGRATYLYAIRIA